jgi:opacity protein-like surface antigen
MTTKPSAHAFLTKSQSTMLVFACALGVSQSAEVFAESPSGASVPDSAFFIGLGASANHTQFNNQDIYATGLSNVYDSNTGAYISSGSAGGPAVDLSMDSDSKFSPSLQVGYFKHFENSKWLWGGKFTYDYLSTSSKTAPFLIPQFGAYGTTSFTGNAVVRSFETDVKHHMSLVPYIGRSFKSGYIYAGAGPTASQINTKITDLVGFADLKGNRTDISGQPTNFSGSDWVYGGTATLGGTYFLSSSWFLDFSYNYSVTKSHTIDYSAPFTNPGTPYTYTGSLIGSTTGSITTQSAALSINRAF